MPGRALRPIVGIIRPKAVLCQNHRMPGRALRREIVVPHAKLVFRQNHRMPGRALRLCLLILIRRSVCQNHRMPGRALRLEVSSVLLYEPGMSESSNARKGIKTSVADTVDESINNLVRIIECPEGH